MEKVKRTDYQKLFPHYKLSAGHKAVLQEYENVCGFEVMGGDQVRNIEDFRQCIQSNLRWLEDLHTDTDKAVNRVANKRVGGLS